MPEGSLARDQVAAVHTTDVLVLGAGSWPELLARMPQRRVMRGGRWLPPPEAEAPSPLLADLLR